MLKAIKFDNVSCGGELKNKIDFNLAIVLEMIIQLVSLWKGIKFIAHNGSVLGWLE